MNQFKAAGIQIPPEDGITRQQLIDLMFMLEDDEYEIISFDSDYSVLYFIFSFSYFEEKIDGGNRRLFEEMMVGIANNKLLENPEHIYFFNDEPVYFGY